MALLGIPEGFTAAEIQSWLRDLAGVAIETSRTDERARPIPQLLHHVLTGLLFSQTELWSHTGQPLPCAAVFVETPQGTAFGWVGRARVVLLVNGEPYDPQWVIVRDESGQEALSAMLPAEAHVLLTLEYWPHGETGVQAAASVDAECGQSFANRPPLPSPARVPMPAGVSPRPTVSPMPATPSPAHANRPATPLPQPIESHVSVAGPLASGAPPPMQQPGLAPDPSQPLQLDVPDATQSLPSTFHASSGTFAMPAVPGAPASSDPASALARPDAAHAAAAQRGGSDAAPHPVGRWLTRIMDFAKKAIPGSEPEAPSPGVPGPARPAPPVLAPAIGATQRATAPAAMRPAHAPAAPVLTAPGSSQASNAVPIAARHEWEEPHAMHALAGSPPPATPSVPALAPVSVAPPESAASAASPSGTHPRGKGGLLAVGLTDILGSRASVSPARPASPHAEGHTASGSAAGPLSPPDAGGVTPEALLAAQPPYPALDAPAPRAVPSPRGPIQIEREPVGASAEFAIPKLPPRDAPKPFKLPVPTAADMVKPAPAAAARGDRAGAPAPAPLQAAPPASPATPAAGSSNAAAATPPRPEVPEPPADFLAEFAASLGADIQDVGLPAPSVEVRRPVPPLPSVMRAVANVANVANVAGAASAANAVPAPNTAPAGPPPLAKAATASPPQPAPAPEPAPVLQAPSAEAPIPVSASELPEILRELPLPAKPEPPSSEPPDGMLVATPVTPRFRRGEWPALDELEHATRPAWKNPWLIAAFVALLFGVGWVVGHSQTPDNDIHATPMSRMLRAVGLSGARFSASVDSDPPGAIISVDGKEVGRRTPATIELVPGVHKITLSMPDLGHVDVEVKGSRGQKLKVNESLHGSLEVTALDKSVPVKVSLDGQAMGFLPLSVGQLPPGLHEVQFSGPNMQPWAQNVSVPIRGTATLRARPMMSPATGVLQVQAILNDEGGSSPLSGASVFVDGELRGSTPETLELPRGPHSIKVTYRGTSAPVQVIDLPGGNRRFAQFHFGLESDLPPLKLKGDFSSLPAKKQTLVEATLEGLDWHDVREAWLHVRTGEGLWRRYQVTIEEGSRGTALSAMFPQNVGDANGRVHWYMSAATSQGDDFYTEMQRSTR
jgi:hypothetical protein